MSGSVSKTRFLAPGLSLLNLFDRTFHVEVPFRHVVVLAVQDFLEAANRFRHGHLFAFSAGEDLRHTEWLTQKALNLTRAEHGQLVLRRKLVHSENCNNIL